MPFSRATFSRSAMLPVMPLPSAIASASTSRISASAIGPVPASEATSHWRAPVSAHSVLNAALVTNLLHTARRMSSVTTAAKAAPSNSAAIDCAAAGSRPVAVGPTVSWPGTVCFQVAVARSRQAGE
jgi:hypothetical protein